MKIVTDCAADLPVEEAEELDVTVAPLYINFPDGQVNSAEITPDDFYNRLEAMAPEMPTTAMPSPKIFTSLYEKLAEKDEEILSIHISSGLSGTLDSAKQGAVEAVSAVVRLFDSMTLSGAQRFQVLAAVRAIKAGWSLERIITHLEKLRGATELIYTLETLSYLRRGGRIGRVQAIAGALLNLKPVIRVEHSDGKYSTVGKTRTIPKALQMMVDQLENEYAQKPLWVSVMHGRAQDQANMFAEMFRQRLNIGRIEILRISPVLGVHTGPGIIGAAVAPFDMIEGIA